jgi:hypothetical protein
MTNQPRRTMLHIFRWPVVIACLSLFGLTVGLLGSGWRDVAAWLALAVPLIIAGRALSGRKH